MRRKRVLKTTEPFEIVTVKTIILDDKKEQGVTVSLRRRNLRSVSKNTALVDVGVVGNIYSVQTFTIGRVTSAHPALIGEIR